jgi:uncharacterized protein (DUF2235 family)
MAKNIVLLCDGTSNEISQDRTNILRLFGTLEKGEKQVVFYDPGVGTFGAENAWSYSYRKTVEILGLATGWGLDQNVKEAYRFLIDHYDDGKRPGGKDVEPDRIYIFGFSRGAYTARVLAGFIHAVGLIDPVNMNLLDYAYRAYKGVGRGAAELPSDGSSDPRQNPFAEVRLFERILRPGRPSIRCLGLFDTVSSILEWGRHGVRLRSHAFTVSNRSVESVRHAVAIDERRTMYEPQLWPEGKEFWNHPINPSVKQPQDVKEVWFSGVHADVGGGYPEAESQLAKIPLEWMIEETRALGLAFKTRTVNEIVLGKNSKKSYVAPDPLAEPNDSMNWAWQLIEYLPRRRSAYAAAQGQGAPGWYIPRGERRAIPQGAAIHRSVFERRGTSTDYSQPNIPDDHREV